jgi:hypothetical protein
MIKPSLTTICQEKPRRRSVQILTRILISARLLVQVPKTSDKTSLICQVSSLVLNMLGMGSGQGLGSGKQQSDFQNMQDTLKENAREMRDKAMDMKDSAKENLGMDDKSTFGVRDPL